MTTVGFGDFHPKSDLERLWCIGLFLFSGAVFSMILSEFTEMIRNHSQLNETLDQSEDLQSFIDLLTHFNKDIPLNANMVDRFEKYFAYRWNCDKNVALKEKGERQMLGMLPEDVHNYIYMNSLHRNFIGEFRSHFRLQKKNQRGVQMFKRNALG